VGSNLRNATTLNFDTSNVVTGLPATYAGNANSFNAGTGVTLFTGLPVDPSETVKMVASINLPAAFNVATAVAINDFFVLGAGDRFRFDVTSLTKNSGGTTTFSMFGSGILSDDLGVFASSPASFTLAGQRLSGTSWNYSFTVATVPEPETYALLGLGLLAVAGFARRKRA
jgi:hypothetical protein